MILCAQESHLHEWSSQVQNLGCMWSYAWCFPNLDNKTCVCCSIVNLLICCSITSGPHQCATLASARWLKSIWQTDHDSSMKWMQWQFNNNNNPQNLICCSPVWLGFLLLSCVAPGITMGNTLWISDWIGWAHLERLCDSTLSLHVFMGRRWAGRARRGPRFHGTAVGRHTSFP